MIRDTYRSPFISSSEFPKRNASSLFCRLYAQSLKLLFQKNALSEIVFLGQGSGISKQQMTHLREFRNKQLLHQKPWLLRDEIGSNAEENFADRVSFHLMALKRNRVYGVLRITPYPFNFHRHSNIPSDFLKGKEAYVEFDKFITLNTDQKLNERIVNIAAAYSVLSLQSVGFVKLIETQKKQTFQKMGIEDSNTEINIGEQRYSLVSSSFQSFFQSHLQNLVVR